MKRLLLLSFLFVLTGAACHAQRLLEIPVSLSLEEVTAEEALFYLADEYGIPLSYSNDILPGRRFSMHMKDVSLKVVLRQILEGTALDYQEIGRQVVLFFNPNASFTISGFLEDGSSGERLINANIFELDSRKGTISNAYGFYSITLPAGPVELAFSYLGYEPVVEKFTLTEDRTINLSLKASLTLDPVEVVSQRLRGAMPGISGSASTHEMDVRDVEQLPALAGEADVVRTIHLLPGVQTGADGVGGLHIRGGDNGQNLILIDGVPVYNISHAAGLFSVFNSSAIRSAKLIKGGFPARYGGRLSSVLDIRTREGNRKTFSARADVGLLSGRLSVEGPIVKDKASFFLSGRHSLVGWYLQPLTQSLRDKVEENGQIGYHFHDLNAKLNYELSKRDNFYLSYYSGNDQYSNSGQSADTLSLLDAVTQDPVYYRFERNYSDAISWGNKVASLRWNHLFSDKLFGNLALTYSRLDVGIEYFAADSLMSLASGEAVERLFDLGRYRSNIRDLGARIDLDFVPSPAHYLRFGFNITHHSFLPGVLSYENFPEKSDMGNGGNLPEAKGEPPVGAMEYVAYVEDEIQLGPRLMLNAGLHGAVFRVDQKSYFSLQPRLLLSWQATPRWKWEAYVNHMQQFIHLLSNSALGLPTELWVPSTGRIPPQQGWQAGGGFQWNFGPGLELGLDGYFKSMNNLLAYAEGALFLNDWEENVTSGDGVAYGLELLLSKKAGKFQGWAGYSLAFADRQYGLINNGSRYPYRFDRRHDFKLALVHRLQDWISLSANWALSSGIAFSLPQGQYSIDLPDFGPIDVVDYGPKNAFRMPVYHRLDVGANLYFQTDKVQHIINLGVYNLYNRKNPLYYNLQNNYVERDNQLRSGKEIKEVWLIPMLPSVNYSIKF